MPEGAESSASRLRARTAAPSAPKASSQGRALRPARPARITLGTSLSRGNRFRCGRPPPDPEAAALHKYREQPEEKDRGDRAEAPLGERVDDRRHGER